MKISILENVFRRVYQTSKRVRTNKQKNMSFLPLMFWQSLTLPQQRWSAFMFAYGTGRALSAEYGERFNLIGQRVPYSIGYGLACTTPYGLWELYKTLNRVEIKLTQKHPENYRGVYQCGLWANNPRVFW